MYTLTFMYLCMYIALYTIKTKVFRTYKLFCQTPINFICTSIFWFLFLFTFIFFNEKKNIHDMVLYHVHMYVCRYVAIFIYIYEFEWMDGWTDDMYGCMNLLAVVACFVLCCRLFSLIIQFQNWINACTFYTRTTASLLRVHVLFAYLCLFLLRVLLSQKCIHTYVQTYLHSRVKAHNVIFNWKCTECCECGNTVCVCMCLLFKLWTELFMYCSL